MILDNVLLIDDNRKVKSFLLKKFSTIFQDATIDVVTNQRKLVETIKKDEFQIIMMNSDLKWTNSYKLLKTLFEKFPYSSTIVFSFDRVVLERDGIKIKADVLIQNFGDDLDLIEYYLELAFEQAVKRKEFKLLNTEFKELFDNVPIGLFRTDYKGHIIAHNNEFVRILGIANARDLVEKGIQDFYVVEKISKQTLLETTIQTPLYLGITQMRREDGQVIWVEIDTEMNYDEDGILRYVNGSVKDITERKKNCPHFGQSLCVFIISRASRSHSRRSSFPSLANQGM